MNDHDRQAIAEICAGIVAEQKPVHACQFDAETIKAIKDWATTYSRLRRAAWWAGGIAGATIIGCMATGFCYVLYEGARFFLQQHGK